MTQRHSCFNLPDPASSESAKQFVASQKTQNGPIFRLISMSFDQLKLKFLIYLIKIDLILCIPSGNGSY